MNQQDIKNLEKELWDAADELRGNSKLTAGEYKDPLLGLVLLRFAQNRYEDAKVQVEKNLPVNPRTGQKREATNDDFAAAGAIKLPEKAKYDYLADLPESEDIAEAINNAMKLIEAEYPDLAGILPKSYQEFDEKLLRDLVRVFNKDAVRNAKGDVFGRIYEFFLMKFSMQGAGAQEGGEFFTPPSLVNLIVNFIQPDHGIIHDPACGSGGMFVQTAHFIEDHSKDKSVNEAITVYGTELKSNNAKLAKMNLAIHGIEGKIIEGNSFYTNPHDLTGKCDFVMANPPFNVDKVDAKNKFLAEDDRLPFGAPLTQKGKVPNGNYLWMQYFYSYLNKNGRAGFVMASSAADAGNSEKIIREKLIETGHVDCIVAISNNFFYTRSLPCHLWFYDKGKKTENIDKILMIDARNVFRKVSSTINDFSQEQLETLTAIISMYRGEIPHLSPDNKWFQELFPKKEYHDITGLCKIVDIEEIRRQEYTLSPGRYVGYNFNIYEDLDLKKLVINNLSYIDSLSQNTNESRTQVLSSFSTDFTSETLVKELFGDLVEFHIGGGWGSEEKTAEFSEEAFVIRGTDFENVEMGKIADVPFRYHKKSNLKSRKLQEWDIIFEVSGGSSTSGVAKTMLITKDILDEFGNNVMCASFCKLIRLKNKNLALYLVYILKYLRDIKATEVYELRSASNIINYNWNAFLKFQEIYIPDDKFIEDLNYSLERLNKIIFNMGKETLKIKESLSFLLPALLK